MSIPILPASESSYPYADELVWKDHQDGAVCLHLATEQVFALNATGKFVWAALRQGRSVEAVAQALSQQFGAPIEACRLDVTRFQQRLSEHQLHARQGAR
jgi:hypothetical protein